MNGELLVKGYKFPESFILNLQDKTIITGEDSFVIYELFNMLESYFSKKNFSDYYLDKGISLILNGNTLSSEEFIVFRIPPTVSLAEESKISKKSILGQVVDALFEDINDRTLTVAKAIEENILKQINILTKEYGIFYIYEANDIFTISKIIYPVVVYKEQEILLKENDQFKNKTFLLNLISQLKTKRKKMLLVELPEYGLRELEITKLFQMIAKAQIDNIIIYTHKIDIINVISSIYNYNVTKNGRLYGFDDYDELEKKLNLISNYKYSEIEKKVFEYIFSLSNGEINNKDEFSRIINEFLS